MPAFVIRLFVLLLLAAPALADTLKVGMSADYPPLHYKHDGQIVGVEADNAVSVGKILGRKVKIVELPFNELLPALNAGKIDIVMSGISITAERSEKMLFSDPYLRIGQMAIMHRSKITRYAQPWSIYRDGVRIGVEPGTTGESFAQDNLKDAVISQYPNPDAAFTALREDKIDLYVHDAPTSWQLANSSDNDDLISLYSPLTEEQLAWAVRLGNSDLLIEVNRALVMMRSSGTLPYILNRWIPVQVEVK
ncbi:MAG: transporter substrate-binding domain-containing protein [Halioglobus sp.]